MMNEWLKAELSEGKETVIPLAGESVVLYLCPRDRSCAWMSDIGSVYTGPEAEESEEADALFWGSAFGLYSVFDGLTFEDILKDYEVYYAPVPPLEVGRFPSPPGIAVKGRDFLSGTA